MHLSGWNFLFSTAFGLLFAAVAVLAWVTRQTRRWWMLAVPVALLVAVSVWLEGWPRLICIDLAALLSVFLVSETGTPAAARAAHVYLWVVLVSAACIIAGIALGGERPAPPTGLLASLVPALLLAGFALKLALVPVFFWLPTVAGAARPLTVALVVSFVDIAAFTELVSIRSAAPWVFDDHTGIWMALAVLSMLGGALLALAQRDLKRMLAYSTIDDMGYLLLGVLASTGQQGALFGALSHAVMKVLLFGALAVAEYRLGRPVTLSDRALAARFPAAAAAFVVGSLGMIGVPPTIGFLGRWRLYLSGIVQGGPLLLAAMILATAVALLYYVRAIHVVWLGQPQEGEMVRSEPAAARVALVVIAVLAVAAGLYPGLWVALVP